MAAAPAPVDPFTAAASSFAGSFGKGLSDAIGGGSGPFVGGASSANSFGTTLDGSGWVVNVAGRQDATQSLQRTSAASPNLYDAQPQWVGSAGSPLMAGLSGVSGLLLVSVALGAVLLARKRRG